MWKRLAVVSVLAALVALPVLGDELGPRAGIAATKLRTDGPQAGSEKSGPAPLIVPLPDKLSWDDVTGFSEMQFSILPHGRSNILFAYGHVDKDVANRFRAALDAARPIEEVWLSSPGGNLDQGLEVGRMLHARKVATHIVKGMRCISACNFMFMGGIIRYIDTGATFEVHMFSNNLADLLLSHMHNPLKTLPLLVKLYPTVNVDVILEEINNSFPQIETTDPVISAAVNAVKKNASFDPDDDTGFKLAVVDTIIKNYNDSHPTAQVEEGAIISRVTLSEDVKAIQMDSAQIAAEIAGFLTEMGLSLKFLTRFAALHNDTPTNLTRSELREFNIINVD